MPTYIRRPASVYDNDPLDLTNGVLLSGADPLLDAGVVNGTEYVVQEISPPARFTPKVGPTGLVGAEPTADGSLYYDIPGLVPTTDPDTVALAVIFRRANFNDNAYFVDWGTQSHNEVWSRSTGSLRGHLDAGGQTQLQWNNAYGASIGVRYGLLMSVTPDGLGGSVVRTAVLRSGSAASTTEDTFADASPVNLVGRTLRLLHAFVGGITRISYSIGGTPDAHSATAQAALIDESLGNFNIVTDPAPLHSDFFGKVPEVDIYGTATDRNAEANPGGSADLTGTLNGLWIEEAA